MANRRAPKPVVSGALARGLMARDGCTWCGSSSDASSASLEYRVPPQSRNEIWKYQCNGICKTGKRKGKRCRVKKNIPEGGFCYQHLDQAPESHPQNPDQGYRSKPMKGEERNNLDDFVAVCYTCSQTEVRRIRFPQGLLEKASEVSDLGFSEMVRQALIEYLRRQHTTTPVDADNGGRDWGASITGEKSRPDFLLETPLGSIGIDVKKSMVSSDPAKMMVARYEHMTAISRVLEDMHAQYEAANSNFETMLEEIRASWGGADPLDEIEG